MRLLIISRKYPPSTGGMQQYAYQLIRHMDQKETVYSIAHEVPRPLLPIFAVYALGKSWLMKNAVQMIYLCDGALAPLGLLLKFVTHKPVVIAINGTDIVYNNRLYQWIIPSCIKRLDKVFCNSNTTRAECLKRGVSERRLCVIPLGVSDEFYRPDGRMAARQQLAKQCDIPSNKKVLLSVGRLIEQKGFYWFISEVMPKILSDRKDVMYLVGGQGPTERTLRRLIQEQGLSDHVKLLGRITDRSELALLYNATDLFIMPNVPTTGRIEGFGLVALEAASCGLPVIASRLDGIQDAIKDGKNGFLVEPLNADQFAKTILSLLNHDEQLTSQVRRYTLETYSWERVVGQYHQQFKDIITSYQTQRNGSSIMRE